MFDFSFKSRTKSRSKSKSRSSTKSNSGKSLLQLISLPIFIISLSVGLFIVYVTNPKKEVIYIYPKPDNIDKVQYKDNNGSCFSFNSKEVQCPSDPKDIQEYQIRDEQ